MRIKKKNQRIHWFMLLPACLFLVVFLLAPLVMMFVLSFRDVDSMMNTLQSYSLSQYLHVFTTDAYVKAIGSTVWVALQTTVICLLMAYPAAYVLVKAPHPRLRAFFYILLVSPLLTSVVIRTFAWIVLLSQNGLINGMLIDLHLIEKPLSMLWNMNAVIIAYVQVMLPFAVLPIATSLTDMDRHLRPASMSLGAGRIRTFFHVTLPLTIPGMITGAIIVFSLAAGSYITPLLVGGRMQPLLPLSIYQQVMQVYNLPLAAAMSFTLLICVLAVVSLLSYLLKRWEARMHA
ncbi:MULTISPECIES: ABC transporter permease [unclassified Bacillus (in: firmicutes)]|uniref:ABC transporter permease n=1 Tax=unclassified Bacillus (in: firmicutes) TaxID=185979 RepID=UPI000626ECCE|nr:MULTISPECIES: ABC transporter permease [unclassified Bacillus (in: firmicutes)]KKK09669.1 ABC transporter permease [Bacillus sp. L_1B0_12]TKD56094.1 ABC transporter permease [Bacillus sp. S2(2019)]